MTTYQKATLLRRLQRLDYDLRLRRYPAVLEADSAEAEQARPTCQRENGMPRPNPPPPPPPPPMRQVREGGRPPPPPPVVPPPHEEEQFRRECERDRRYVERLSEGEIGWDAETQMAYFGSDRR